MTGLCNCPITGDRLQLANCPITLYCPITALQINLTKTQQLMHQSHLRKLQLL